MFTCNAGLSSKCNKCSVLLLLLLPSPNRARSRLFLLPPSCRLVALAPFALDVLDLLLDPLYCRLVPGVLADVVTWAMLAIIQVKGVNVSV